MDRERMELVIFIVLFLYGLKQLAYEILLILTIPTLQYPMCEMKPISFVHLILSNKQKNNGVYNRVNNLGVY
jgi:hypothetical protein